MHAVKQTVYLAKNFAEWLMSRGDRICAQTDHRNWLPCYTWLSAVLLVTAPLQPLLLMLGTVCHSVISPFYRSFLETCFSSVSFTYWYWCYLTMPMQWHKLSFWILGSILLDSFYLPRMKMSNHTVFCKAQARLIDTVSINMWLCYSHCIQYYRWCFVICY